MPETDPRMPPAQDCVLPFMLDRRARELTDKTFIIFDDYSSWTYAETRRQARGTAAALHALGVRRGQNVAVILPNGPTALRVWLGLNYLGAVFAPLNTALRGRILEHQLANSAADLLILDGEYLEHFRGIALGGISRAVVCGPHPPGALAVELLGEDAIAPGEIEPPETPALQPWDIQLLHYTSGTTGKSKGVPITYLQLYIMQRDFSRIFNRDDRYLLLFPLFHVAGTDCLAMVIHLGASLVMPQRFQTEAFWPTIRRHGVTFTDLIYSMVSFLLRAPPREDDRDHPLRTILTVPVGRDSFEFSRRFGVNIYSGYDMTEIPPVFVSGLNPTEPGACGRLQPGYEVRIVDDYDIEVPEGQVGQLIVRADCPWVIAAGYYRDPEATAAAWRNGWFHTGDAFRRDAGGNYFFAGRFGDVIRRRGENISAQELEDVVLEHPAVVECAAVGVASEYGEDDVLLVIAPGQAAAIEPEALLRFLEPRLPRYMLPRFIRTMRELPKSVTTKIRKQQLREEGVTRDTWDREHGAPRRA